MLPCNSVLGAEFVGEVVALGGVCSPAGRGGGVCALPFLSCGSCALPACRAAPLKCSGLACIGVNAPGGFAQYVATSECNNSGCRTSSAPGCGAG